MHSDRTEVAVSLFWYDQAGRYIQFDFGGLYQRWICGRLDLFVCRFLRCPYFDDFPKEQSG